MIFESNSIEDTKRIAKNIAKTLKGNEVILLEGELGAGKTTFTKFLGEALGVTDTITSPTFTFLKTYQGKFPLNHFDLYRAGDEEEVLELGLKEYIGKGICVIEWNKFTGLKNAIKIVFTTSKTGQRWLEVIEMTSPELGATPRPSV